MNALAPLLQDGATPTKVPRLTHTYARDAHEWYVEPRSVTRLLLSVERFDGRTWDPACGQGNVTAELIAATVDAIGTDVIDRGAEPRAHGWCGTLDFLADEGAWPFGAVNVVTNPPFFRARGTERFIRKALRFASGKVAVFVDQGFQTGGRRARGLFAEHPPTRIWNLADRPSCPPGDYLRAGNEAAGGRANWCWIVWEIGAPRAAPRLGWLAEGLQQPRFDRARRRASLTSFEVAR